MSENEHLQVKAEIIAILQEILADKGAGDAEIQPNAELMGGSIDIDSLDLATLVVRLTESRGKDPFADGFRDFRTVDQLAALYSE